MGEIGELWMFTNKLNLVCLLRSQYLALPLPRSSPLSLEFPVPAPVIAAGLPLWQS